MFTVHILKEVEGSQLEKMNLRPILTFDTAPPSPHLLKIKSTPPTAPNETCSTCVFDLFLYKKGTIYITFIKSFSIIKYNITLLQKFQIPATIQDKLPIRVHKVSFFSFQLFFLNNVQSFMCQQFWQDETKLFTVTNQVFFSKSRSHLRKKAKTSTRKRGDRGGWGWQGLGK